MNGLTLLAALVGALPADIVDLRDPQHRLKSTSTISAVVIVVALATFGILRLPASASATVPGVKIRIMQPNIPQSAHYDADGALDLVRGYLDLSDRATSPTTNGLADVTHLIWPESPFPFPLAREPRVLSMIATALGSHTVLLTGGVRVEPEGPGSFRAWNSLFVINRGGHIADTYDKVHLVPFGEYLPLGTLMRRLGLRQFVSAPGGFEAGTDRQTIMAPGIGPIEPLICYEAIFPGEVMPPNKPGGQRPVAFVNITNDAWFGMTPGPYQHLAQARLRSVEEGIALVRAANSGISAVIDGYGRIIAELGLGKTGVVDSALPAAIAPTIYSRYGDIPVFVLWITMLGAGFFLARKKVHG